MERTIITCDGCGKVVKDSNIYPFGDKGRNNNLERPYITVEITIDNEYSSDNSGLVHRCTACSFGCFQSWLKDQKLNEYHLGQVKEKK